MDDAVFQMRRDVASTYNSLVDTLRAVLTRGRRLAIINDRSVEIVKFAILVEARSALAAEKIRTESRHSQRKFRSRCIVLMFVVSVAILVVWIATV